MRVIVHISDIHFGTEIPAIVDAVTRDIHTVAPDLLVVSGDLTQRARSRQFKKARHFLDQFGMPKILVPGNHDVPLYNLVKRLNSPFTNFREYIEETPYPMFIDDELGVIGVSSVRPKHWKAGRLTRPQLAQLTAMFHQLDDALLKVLVLHHNLVLSPGAAEENIPERKTRVLSRLIKCGVDLILLGHDHRTFITGLPNLNHRPFRAILTQAGTAFSTRTRKEPNSYNVVSVKNNRVQIQVKSFEHGAFVVKRVESFEEHERRQWVCTSDARSLL